MQTLVDKMTTATQRLEFAHFFTWFCGFIGTCLSLLLMYKLVEYNPLIVIFITFAVVIFAAWLVHVFIEEPSRKIGKKIAKKISINQS